MHRKVVFLFVGAFLLVLAVFNWLGVLGDWYYLDTGNIAQAQLVYIQLTHWVLVGSLGIGLILYGSRSFPPRIRYRADSARERWTASCSRWGWGYAPPATLRPSTMARHCGEPQVASQQGPTVSIHHVVGRGESGRTPGTVIRVLVSTRHP